MAWIQVHQQLKDHRKLLAAADELEIDPAHMLGLLVSFWLWALDNAPSGSLQGISSRMIARAAQWSGNPENFVTALENAALLDVEDDGSLSLHDWYEYAGKLIDQREAEKNRSRVRRAAAAAKPQDDRRTTAGQSADEPADDQEKTAGRVDQSRPDQSRSDQSRPDKTREKQTTTENEEGAPDGASAAEPVPYKEIVDLYHAICTSYPELRNVSAKRKKAIAARWKEYKKNLDTFRELFEAAEASPFLKGRNERNWTADFNWLMNAENMAKVLEGKYADTPRVQPAPQQRAQTGKPDTMGVLAGIIASEEGGDLF